MSEDDRILVCPYCKVRQILTASEYLTTYVPPSEQYRKYSFFVPYWRMKGIEFKLGASQKNFRLLDRTACACSLLPCPHSLGYRPQAVALKFLEPSSEGHFLRPTLPLEKFLGRMQYDQAVPERDAIHSVLHRFIGEIISLVYWPYFMDGDRLHDGLTGNAIGPSARPDFTGNTTDMLQDGIQFLSALCPECGWVLEGTTDTQVLFCPQCEVGWRARGRRLVQTTAEFLDMPGDGEFVWLPFWRLTVGSPDIALSSRGDLIRFLNLASVPGSALDNTTAHVWVPAFKIAPPIFLRLAGALTVAQKDASGSGSRHIGTMYPVTLPEQEARESVPLALMAAANARKKVVPRLVGATFEYHSADLAMVPFVERGYELVQPELNVAVHRNALKWGKAI